MHTQKPHAHAWIDPTEPPIARAPYVPIVGTARRQMKAGRRYVCRICCAPLIVPEELAAGARVSAVEAEP